MLDQSAKTNHTAPSADAVMPGKKVNVRRGIFLALMCSMAVLHFLVFYLYVNLSSILMAFQTEKNGQTIFSLENFGVMFEMFAQPDSILIQSLGNTFKFFATGLLVTLPITVFVAYFIYKRIWGYRFFRVIFFLPSIISAVVLTMLYTNIVGVKGPVAAAWQFLFGLSKPPEFLGQSEYALNTILVYCVWTGLGGNLILLNGAMSRIPNEVLESARLDGVGMLRELVQLILPLIWPTLTTLIILSFVGIFTASGPILLFTQGGFNTYTISYWIFDQVYGAAPGSTAQYYASTVGLFFTLISLPIILGVKRLLSRYSEDVEY